MLDFNIKNLLATHYKNTDWQHENLIFAASMAVLSQIMKQQGKPFKASDPKAKWQFSSNPNDPRWKTVYSAEWMSPVTYHRLFAYPERGKSIDSKLIDAIPGVWADVDWHSNPSRKWHWGDLHVALLEMGIPETLLLETPRGFHVFWYFREPLRCRWEKADTGEWRQKNGVKKALSWWRDVSFALHHTLIEAGIPADVSCAGQTARLMRRPSEKNVRFYDEHCLYDLQELSDLTESYRLEKVYQVGSMQIHTDGIVPQGMRNSACWPLALSLAKEYKGAEKGLKILLKWCNEKCVPAYPEAAAKPIWKWACRKQAEGRLFFSLSTPSQRSRKEQGKYASKKYRLSTDEKISRAVLEMKAAGITEPWNDISELSFRSGVSKKTLSRRKKNLNL